MIYYEDKIEYWIKTIKSYLNYLARLLFNLALSILFLMIPAFYIQEIILKKESGIPWITLTIMAAVLGIKGSWIYFRKASLLRRKRVPMEHRISRNPWHKEDQRTIHYAQVITIQVKEFGEKQWIIQCLDFPPVVTDFLSYSIRNLINKIREKSDPELDLLVKIEYPSSVFLKDDLPTEVRIVN